MNKPLTSKFLGKKIHPDFTVTDDGIYCLEADIKSAVELLKERLKPKYELAQSENIRLNWENEYNLTLRIIDEAFPDLCPSGDLIADKSKSAKLDNINIVAD